MSKTLKEVMVLILWVSRGRIFQAEVTVGGEALVAGVERKG